MVGVVEQVGELETLVVVEAITRLKGAYFRLMDARDWAAWGAVLSEDCVMTLAGDPVVRLEGRDAIVESARRNLDPRVGMHLGHMPEIAVTRNKRDELLCSWSSALVTFWTVPRSVTSTGIATNPSITPEAGAGTVAASPVVVPADPPVPADAVPEGVGVAFGAAASTPGATTTGTPGFTLTTKAPVGVVNELTSRR